MKKANRKLRDLEELAKDPDYEGILKFAYRVAKRDVKELGLGDVELARYRIPYDPKTGRYNTNKLKAALKRVEAFNKMPTSSRMKIKKLYIQDTINFNKAFGTNFTWQELRTFTKKSKWDQLKKDKGSDVIQRAIQHYIKKRPLTKEEKEKMSNNVKEASENHKTIAKETSVEDDWMKRLEKAGLAVDMLYKGTGDFVEISDEESPFID